MIGREDVDHVAIVELPAEARGRGAPFRGVPSSRAPRIFFREGEYVAY